MKQNSLKNRKILSSSSAKKSTLRAEKEKQDKETTSHGDQESSELQTLLKAQTEKNQKKPWNRLDRGIKIQKIRSWAKTKEWPAELCKKAEDILIKKVKAGSLTSSNAIIYDKNICEIIDIPCLKIVYSETDDTTPIDILFQQTDKKSRRKKTV